MSVRTPILTLTCCALAAPQVKMTARAARLIFRFIDVSSCFAPLWLIRLDTEIVVQLVDVCIEFRIGELVDDTTMFHHVIAVRNGRGEAEVLFHQEDGKAPILEGPDRLADLLNNDRREAFRRLIKQQQAGARAEKAPTCKHVLFTAGQLRALAGAEPFLQVREELKNLIETEAARLYHRRKQQVLLDIEACKAPPLFRAEGNAAPRDLIGTARDQLIALKPQRAGQITAHT